MCDYRYSQYELMNEIDGELYVSTGGDIKYYRYVYRLAAIKRRRARLQLSVVRYQQVIKREDLT